MQLLNNYIRLNLGRLFKTPKKLVFLIILPLVLYSLGVFLTAQTQGLPLFEFGEYYLICAIVFSLLINSYLYLSRNMSNDKNNHFDVLLRNHKKYFLFNLSYVVVSGIIILFTTILLFILSWFYGGLVWSPLRYIALLLFTFIGFLSFSLFGITVSLAPRKYFSLVGYVTLFVAFLSGLFLPLESLTTFIAPVMRVIPVYSLADIGWQFIFFRAYEGMDFAFLGLWTLGFFSVALIFYPQASEYSTNKNSKKPSKK
ncbi:MAG: ABC transporter permease [Bifidobacteriaceae bacterium]|jgi:hypothetical protein|nr:ABC transporter permease [Bifidobacteriaceae bacterium]